MLVITILLGFTAAATAQIQCSDATYTVTDSWSFPSGQLAPNQDCFIKLNFDSNKFADISVSASNMEYYDTVKVNDSFNNFISYSNGSSLANFAMPPSSIGLFVRTVATSKMSVYFTVKVKTFNVASAPNQQLIVSIGKSPALLNLTSIAANSLFTISSSSKAVISPIGNQDAYLENGFVYDGDTLVGTLRNYAGTRVIPSSTRVYKLYIAKEFTTTAFALANDYNNLNGVSYFVTALSVPYNRDYEEYAIFNDNGTGALTIVNSNPSPSSGINLLNINFFDSDSSDVVLNKGGPVNNPQGSSTYITKFSPDATDFPQKFTGSAWTFSMTKGGASVKWNAF